MLAQYLIALLMMFWCGVAEAGQREVDRAEFLLSKRGKVPLTAQERSQLQTRGWRDRRVDDPIKPPVTALVRPKDWKRPVERGTIDLNLDKWRNYSWHTLEVLNGSTIDCGNHGCNFSQLAVKTEVFDRSPGFGHNLVFKGRINLSNVMIYPDWDFTDFYGNTAQIDRIGTFNTDGMPEIVESKYVANHPDNVPGGRVIPPGRIE